MHLSVASHVVLSMSSCSIEPLVSTAITNEGRIPMVEYR